MSYRAMDLHILPEHMSKKMVASYKNALNAAERLLEEDLEKYLATWRHCVPVSFQDKDWDFQKFSRGERIVNETLPDGLIDEIFEQVDRWDLAQHIKDRDPNTILY